MYTTDFVEDKKEKFCKLMDLYNNLDNLKDLLNLESDLNLKSYILIVKDIGNTEYNDSSQDIYYTVRLLFLDKVASIKAYAPPTTNMYKAIKLASNLSKKMRDKSIKTVTLNLYKHNSSRGIVIQNDNKIYDILNIENYDRLETYSDNRNILLSN